MLLLAAASAASAAEAWRADGTPAPSPTGGGVEPSGGDDTSVCTYNATLAFNTTDPDHCCECFHDTCDLVRANCPLGTSGTSLFNYFAMHYCTLGNIKPISFIFLAIITLVVFSLLGTTADNFFVVQLETLSETLKLSPSTAAITLLALGNSAPDVFSDLAAVQGANDFSLAIGELMGASMFLTTIVFAAVILYATNDGSECVVDKTPIRDILSFAVVLLATFLFILTGDKITSIEAVCIIGAYVIYVICVIVYTKKDNLPEEDIGRGKSVSSMSWARKSIASHHILDEAENTNHETGELETGLMASRTSLSLQAAPVESKDEEDDEEEELVGVDWDASASTFDKVTFVFEYPVSLLRWLSIAGADNTWSARRRFLAHFVPLGAAMIIFLDFSPNWTGGTPYDGFSSSGFVATSILTFLVGTAMFQFSNDDRLPSFNWALVAIAFVSTIAWLDLLGNECVAVLESIGVITGLTSTPQGHSILGVTLLSWANSIGDFIADTAVTKAGKPEMGVSAVFGSPMLTCCLGIGISTLIGSFSNGKGYVDTLLDSELSLSFVFMTISLCSSLIVILTCGSKFPRWYATYLFVLYALYMLFSILTVLDIFELVPGRKATGDSVSSCPKF